MLTTDKLNVVLTDIYEPMVRMAYQQDVATWNWFSSGEIKEGETNSRGKRDLATTTPNASFGYRGERGVWPAPDESDNVEMRAGFTRLMMSFGVTPEFLKMVASPQSMIGSFDEYSKRDRNTILWHLSQDAHGDGSGMKAVVKTVNVGTKTITCATELVDGDTLGAQRLLRRGRYQFFDPITGLQRTGGGVTVSLLGTITHPTATGVFSTAIPSDVAVGDIVVHEDSYNKAIRGMGYGIDDSARKLHGLSKALYPQLNSTRHNAQGMPLDFPLMNLYEFISSFSTGPTGELRTFVPITQTYAATLLGHPLKRLGNNDNVLKVGFEEIEVNGRKWVKDRWALEDRIRYVDKAAVERLVFEDIKLWDYDGLKFRAEAASTGAGFKDGLVGAWVARLDLAWPGAQNCGEVWNLSTQGLPRGYKYAKH